MALVIRDAQRAVLQRDSDVRWFVGRLRDTYPRVAEAPAAQRFQWVREGIARATAAGLGRAELFQFLCFEQTFHPGCLDDADFQWARDLLGQTGKDPGQRMKALRQATVRRLLQREAELELEAVQADEPEAAPVEGGP